MYSLVYSWIDNELQIGPTLAFMLWLSDFETKTSFGFLIKKSGGLFYFFKNSKNELVRPKMVYLAILAKIRSFSDNSDIIANTRLKKSSTFPCVIWAEVSESGLGIKIGPQQQKL